MPVIGLASAVSLPVLSQALAASPAAAAVPRAVAPTGSSTFYTLGGDAADVKTANGETWTLLVGYSTTADLLTLNMQREVSGASNIEFHNWELNASASSFSFSTASGVGKLNPGKQTSPVATVDVTFKATAHRAVTCASGSETVYTGTLKGEIELVTSLKGGGTVGGKSLSFTVKGAVPSVSVDKSCFAVINECIAGIIFDWANGPKATLAAGGTTGPILGKVFDLITVAEKTYLKAPKGATRSDGGILTGKPATYDSSTKTVSVSTSPSTFLTGSVAVKAVGKIVVISAPCFYAGKTYTLTYTTASKDATWKSPSGKPLTAHTSLTGKISAPVSATGASFSIVTVK